MNNLPNLIIAGVNKAGTTSLFTYLSQHPQVGSSRIKEACYFLPIRYGDEPAIIEEYLSLFEHIHSTPVIMEATPGYFYGGMPLINQINSTLPDVKIIILLRNPTDRLISFFNFMKSMLLLDQNMSIDSYIRKCRTLSRQDLKDKNNNPYFGIEGGFYNRYISDWIDQFGDRLNILFLDDLKRNPGEVFVELCEWLGVESDFYNDFDFSVENRTAQYTNKRMQQIALFINVKSESLFRKFPIAKQCLRGIYAFLNQEKIQTITQAEKDRINNIYCASNHELASNLRNIGIHNLPRWLDEK